MSQLQSARAFFDACETGEGWETCKAYCHDTAGFDCQADALTGVATLADYVEWMKGLLTPVPDGSYTLKAFAWDAERNTAIAAATFHGTQTGEGGPVAPTGKTVSSEYVYLMTFDGEKISHMTKVWNDSLALRALGWA